MRSSAYGAGCAEMLLEELTPPAAEHVPLGGAGRAYSSLTPNQSVAFGSQVFLVGERGMVVSFDVAACKQMGQGHQSLAGQLVKPVDAGNV
jgi:hypothetical protein